MEHTKPLNILFITLGRVERIDSHGIYSDLLRCLRDRGHKIYTVCPRQKRTGLPTAYLEEEGVHKLFVRTGNVTESRNLLEKGVATLTLDRQFIRAIKLYLDGVRFDLILYTTPPITFVGAVAYVKRRDLCKSYLLLKDIFPQNAVDLGMMRTDGPMGLLYRLFRAKERRLYAVSDRIGCMSPANVAYLLSHNPEIDQSRVEVCPNCVQPRFWHLTSEEREAIRRKYGLPEEQILVLYGGNLGKPQGIPFLIDCLRAQKRGDMHFVIVGDGTEYGIMERFVREERPANVTLLSKLPRDDYDTLAAASDLGLILLDHRFTIPNFPSRMLSYLEAGLPVLAATDPNTDVGQIAEEGGFGWWCESNDPAGFLSLLDKAASVDLRLMGEQGRRYLTEHYHVEAACDQLLRFATEEVEAV